MLLCSALPHQSQELEEYAAGQHAFTFEMEDPAGNSFIAGTDGGPASECGHAEQLYTVLTWKIVAVGMHPSLDMPSSLTAAYPAPALPAPYRRSQRRPSAHGGALHSQPSPGVAHGLGNA